ncbi:MAG: hypothetical protein HOI70_04925, partial [Opitutae bacterium]|nr:hypothetical protein [Opitutae bacterium]
FSPVLTDYENDIIGLGTCDCLGKSFYVEGVDGPVIGLGRVVDESLVVKHQTKATFFHPSFFRFKN